MKTIITGLLSLFVTLSIAQNFNMELLGRYEFNQELNDIWGYADEEGNEYALVGQDAGFSVINVTDASNMVETFSLVDVSTAWRDIKTWNDHAYITCECSSGLLIVDLSPLPQSNSLSYTYWQSGDTFEFSSAHNLFIDENGIAYIFGANTHRGGALMLDLNEDPMDPKELGVYTVEYLHDGVVRGDTLWGGAFYNGEVHVVDVSDKANPQLISSWATPDSSTHNVWFSDDNNTLFTTDEVSFGSIASYDVSNVNNPIELDAWTPKDTAIIPHNTHFLNDFLITSHNTIGLNIIDVKRPNNMIQTGLYDTAPDYLYEGFNGCWGAYPYLPSGKILATDVEEGLYVFNPTYVRGCYLEGSVTDQHTGESVGFPQIEIIEDSLTMTGSLTGKYAAATLDAGTYTVKVSHPDYTPQTITGVELVNGELTVLDVVLNNWPLNVQQLQEDEIRILPNPTSDRVIVYSGEPIEHWQLISMSGQVLMERSSSFYTTSETIDLSSLPKAVYFLKVQAGQSDLIEKLIVQ